MQASTPRFSAFLMVALLVGANLMWGSSWVIAKVILETLTPMQVAAWRMIISAVLLLPLTVWQVRQGLLSRKIWPMLLFLALIGFVLPKAFNLWGVSHTTAASASLLMSIEPLFTLLLGVLILRERVTGLKLAALLLGAAGTYLIVARGFGWPDWSAMGAVGDLVFMLGLLMEAAYSVWGKEALARSSPLVMTSATITASLVFWLPVAAWDVSLHGLPPFTLGSFVAVAYMAVGLTIVGYWIWFIALQHVDAGRVGLTIFVQPLCGTALSVLVLDERLTVATWVGGGLVLASLAFALRPERASGGGSTSSAC